MKRFIFSLEKVLEVKKIEEKTIQKHLLYIQAKIYEVEKNILSIDEKISQERHNLSSLKSSKKNSNDIMVHYNYIESLSIDKENLYIDLDNLKMTESNVRKKLVEKSKERKTLEKMKENRYIEYRKDYYQEQQKKYDEISISNHRIRHGATS